MARGRLSSLNTTFACSKKLSDIDDFAACLKEAEINMIASGEDPDTGVLTMFYFAKESVSETYVLIEMQVQGDQITLEVRSDNSRICDQSSKKIKSLI